LGASVTQQPPVRRLLSWLDGDRFEDTRVSVSSVRAATVTPPAGADLARTGQQTRDDRASKAAKRKRLRRVVNQKPE